MLVNVLLFDDKFSFFSNFLSAPWPQLCQIGLRWQHSYNLLQGSSMRECDTIVSE